MAHKLGFRRYISDTEWLEIILTAWRASVQSYTPQSATMKPDGTYNDVTETIELMFVSANGTQEMQTDIETVQRWMVAAAERQRTGTGDRVYVFLTLDGETDMWRSEILNGAFQMETDALNIWGQRKLIGRISFTRRYFWEGNEREIPIASQTQVAIALGGRTIQNRRDTTGGNWVEIGSNQVGGVLPTPAKIMIKNPAGTGTFTNYRDVFIANTGPVRYQYLLKTVIEAESAVSQFQGGVIVGALSNVSNNARLDITFNGAQSITCQWMIPRETVAIVAGRTVRFMARFTFFQGGALYLKPSLKADDGTAAVAADYDSEVRITSNSDDVIDLGTVTFPSSGSLSMSPLRLQVDFRSTASALLELDDIQMFVGDVRTLYFLKQSLPGQASLVDDGPRGIGYQLGTDGLEDMSLQGHGQPIMLVPDQYFTQRIYFLFNDGGFGSQPNKVAAVRILHRPRRLTI